MHPRALLEFRSILLQYNAPHAELTYRSELVSIKTCVPGIRYLPRLLIPLFLAWRWQWRFAATMLENAFLF